MNIKYDPTTGKITKNGRLFQFEDKKCGYARTRYNGKTVLVHRLAFLLMTGTWPHKHVDHINGMRTDNSWSNLRQATRTQNNRSRKGYAISGFKGVQRDTDRSFRARIRINGKDISLGSYKTAIEAAAAYDKKAVELFGNFAKLNFPVV